MSYEALRNYHYDREPPPSYLARVAEVFGVRLDYLIRGEGPVTEAEAAMQESEAEGADLFENIRDAIPELADLDYAVSVALLTYIGRWVRAHVRTGYEVQEEELIEHVKSVWTFMHTPLESWSRRIGEELYVDPNGASDYMMAMLHALNFSLQIVAPAGNPQSEEEETNGDS